MKSGVTVAPHLTRAGTTSLRENALGGTVPAGSRNRVQEGACPVGYCWAGGKVWDHDIASRVCSTGRYIFAGEQGHLTGDESDLIRIHIRIHKRCLHPHPPPTPTPRPTHAIQPPTSPRHIPRVTRPPYSPSLPPTATPPPASPHTPRNAHSPRTPYPSKPHTSHSRSRTSNTSLPPHQHTSSRTPGETYSPVRTAMSRPPRLQRAPVASRRSRGRSRGT